MMDLITTYAKDNENLLKIKFFKIDSPSDEGWHFYKKYLNKHHDFEVNTPFKKDILINVKQLHANDKIFLGDITDSIGKWTALSKEVIEHSLNELSEIKKSSKEPGK